MSALQVDERHYNACYGLCVVFLRQEKFEFAEHHFRFAYHINPVSSVLVCYLGMALHSLKREMEALEMIEADPKNVLPIYQKAQIMISAERYDLALEELHRLERLVPKESTIFALMGKIYKHLNILISQWFSARPRRSVLFKVHVLGQLGLGWAVLFLLQCKTSQVYLVIADHLGHSGNFRFKLILVDFVFLCAVEEWNRHKLSLQKSLPNSPGAKPDLRFRASFS